MLRMQSALLYVIDPLLGKINGSVSVIETGASSTKDLKIIATLFSTLILCMLRVLIRSL